MQDHQVDINAVMQALGTKIAGLEIENAQLRALVDTLNEKLETVSNND